MSDIQTALAYLDYYLDKAPYGEGAVLVTGHWGSGKTRTIRAYMRARDERLLAAEPLGDKHVYVSLYGASSIEDVLARIFAARHPRIGAGPVRFIATMAGRALNGLTRNAAVGKTDGTSVRQYLLQLRNATLVVDDLERAEMSAGVIMGYLNSFIEHEQVKAIIIAHEDEIQWPGFKAQKEKLISRTLTISSSVSEAYDYFVSRMKSKEARTAANASKTEVLTTFENTGLPNLRSLRAALDDFDRLVGMAGNELKAADAALESVLTIMVALWTHIRSGQIQYDDLDDAPSLIYEVFMRSRFEKEPETEGAAAKVLGRHPNLSWTDPVVPIKMLARMAASGALSPEDLNNAVRSHSLLNSFKTAPAWVRLWRWMELGIEDYHQVVDDLRSDLANRRITDPAIILHVFASSTSICRRDGDPLAGDPEVVMRRYVDDLVAEGRLELFKGHPFDEFEELTSYGGFGFAGIGDDEVISFREFLAEKLNVETEKSRRGESSAVLEKIRGGEFRILQEGGDDSYYRTPILHHIDVSDFADIVLVDGALPRGISNALRSRYSGYRGLVHPLAQEGPWFLDLMRELSTRAQALPPPHSTWVQERLASIEKDVRKNLSI